MKYLLFVFMLLPLGLPAQSTTAEGQRQDDQHTTEHSTEAETASLSEFPTLHPLVVHFPVVLLPVAFLLQLLSFFLYRKGLEVAVLTTLTLGVIGAFLAVYIWHPHTHELPDAVAQLLSEHEKWATYTFWLSLVALVLAYANFFFLKDKKALTVAVAVLLAGASVTVTLAGHHGSQLVYLEGVGAQGKYLKEEGQGHSH